ncbi:MAG: hypothetical protein LPH21_10840 [Shewanella sp.]|nr:hypothetical protein [Shewanella sp.]
MDKQQAVGRLTAYLGGGAVGISAQAQKAAAQTAENTVTLLQYPIPVPNLEITVGDITTVGGFLIVAARFVVDMRKDREQRRDKEQDK